jgi:hypothetical protein
VSLTVRLSALVLLSGLCCSAPAARPRGPEPVYERPAAAPSDAGSRVTNEDPFAAAAESEWIGGSEDGGTVAADQQSDQPASDSLDASGASTLH